MGFRICLSFFFLVVTMTIAVMVIVVVAAVSWWGFSLPYLRAQVDPLLFLLFSGISDSLLFSCVRVVGAE